MSATKDEAIRQANDGVNRHPTLSITKAQLRDMYRQWEQDFRDGKTMTTGETAALSVEEVADNAANHVWKLLGGDS